MSNTTCKCGANLYGQHVAYFREKGDNVGYCLPCAKEKFAAAAIERLQRENADLLEQVQELKSRLKRIAIHVDGPGWKGIDQDIANELRDIALGRK